MVVAVDLPFLELNFQSEYLDDFVKFMNVIGYCSYSRIFSRIKNLKKEVALN